MYLTLKLKQFKASVIPSKTATIYKHCMVEFNSYSNTPWLNNK